MRRERLVIIDEIPLMIGRSDRPFVKREEQRGLQAAGIGKQAIFAAEKKFMRRSRRTTAWE